MLFPRNKQMCPQTLRSVWETEIKVLYWNFTLFLFQKATTESDGHPTVVLLLVQLDWRMWHRVRNLLLYTGTELPLSHWKKKISQEDQITLQVYPDKLLSSCAPEKELLCLFIGLFLKERRRLSTTQFTKRQYKGNIKTKIQNGEV